MKQIKNRATKIVTLVLACAVLQVYAAFALAAENGVPVGAGAPAPQGAQGRLVTTGNNPITLSGNSAKTGETVFSGQQLQTPSGTGATVQLGQLGRVDVAPNSNLKLDFGERRIAVVLTSGCIILTANPGVTGTVEAQGTTQSTDPEKGGVIDICTSQTPGGAPIVGQGAAAAAGAGTSGGAVAAATVAAGGAGGGLGTGVSSVLVAATVGAFSIIGSRVISDSDNPVFNEPCTPIPNNTSPNLPPQGCTP